MNKTTVNFIFIIYVTILSIFITGCDEKFKVVEKKTKIDDHFYPIKDYKLIETNKINSVYVPVYSHIYTSEDKYEAMGITLSIRNTDFNFNLILKDISYYDTKGNLVETYLDKPHILKPMSSIDITVELIDMRGGSGANFIVKYSNQDEISEPIIQAVMLNSSSTKYFAFVTNGQLLK